MWNFVLPYLFNPDQANLGAKTAFIFGGFSIFCCVYLYFYHPETKGRSYQELDELFAKGVPARQFASYVTDAQTEAIQVKERVQDGELSL
jgi:SP family general alpha glucoside:H+ symporter-like MFS transporter